MLVDMTINDYLDKAASGSPTPGGGSVCALVGALGASLSSMVAEITLSKDITDEEKKKMEEMLLLCRKLIKDLKEGIDSDTDAFDKVMAAYKMPKTTDEEKKERSEFIQHALKGATELPYKVASLCLDVMHVSIDMLKKGNKNAASDASVSGLLGYAALNGALYNVKINLNTIKDIEYVKEMKQKADKISSESEELLSEIKSLSHEIFG